MDLLHLVDRLEELVASAQRMPIGSRAIVDRRRLLDIIDQMRVAIPDEVRQAREIVAQSESLRRDAEEESTLVVARAQERATALVEEHHVTRAARLRAEELAADAERRIEERTAAANEDIERRLAESRRLAEQQMSAADSYAQELLSRLDRQLDAFQRSVRSGLDQLTQPVDDLDRPQTDAERAAELADAVLAAAGAAPRSLDEAVRRMEADDELHDPPLRADLGELVTRARHEEQGDAFAAPMPPPEPGVIDDFSMPALDDAREDEESDRPANGTR